MSVYSAYCSRNSLEKQEGFRLIIPGGMATGERDWYPLVLFYDASQEFSMKTGTPTQLNIYYNFPAYDLWKGSSWLFEPDSPYYTRFDLFELVLDDFGLNPAQGVFDWEMDEEQQISYAGKDGWSRVDARITTNGAQHSPDEFRVSYLQYGIPPDSTEEFKPVTLYGRLIGQYFEEWDTSIFFYILAPDLNVLDSCDRRILSASRLENS